MGKRRIGADPLPIPIVVPAPTKGVDRSMPVALQPPLTCTDALNVVTFPALSDRGGIGKRAGTRKAFAELLSDAVGTHRITGLMEFRARQDDTLGSGGPPTDWEDLPPGLGAAGNWLAEYAEVGTLNVCGQFTTAGGASSERFAQFDIPGAGWTDPANSFSTSVDNPSRAILWDAGDGSGTCLYAVGGLGATPTINRVARWNGSSWTDLLLSNTGVTTIHGICVYNNKLYVCGNFTALNGTSCNRVGYWDPATAIGAWAQPGASALNGKAFCMDVYNGELYVGGDFTTADGTATKFLARWNGSAWAAVGGFSPVNGTPTVQVLRTASLGGTSKLYIGGNFQDIGAIAGTITGVDPSDHGLITSWNGTNFVPLQNGLRDPSLISSLTGVLSIEFYNDGVSPGVWVAGSFSQASTADGLGLSCPSIAKWDGTQWTTVAKGLAGGAAQNIRHMIPAGASQSLYATGSFTTKNNVGACSLAAWDGTSWTAFTGAGVARPSDTQPSCLLSASLVSDAEEKLYVGVYGSLPSYWPNYYGCGPATPSATVGSARYSMASWNGQWNEMSGYSRGQPNGASAGETVMAACASDISGGMRLYVVGSFTSSPGAHMAAWNGASWSTVDATGLTGGNGLCVCEATIASAKVLVVGGTFTGAGGVANTSNLATWNGTFASIGTGNGNVWAVCYDGSGKVYVGGEYTTIGGAGYVRVCYYDGSLHAMGTGCNSTVYSICVYNGSVYVAGAFTTADGVACAKIARWTGSTFVPLGGGLNDDARCMYVFDDGTGSKLYVGGKFTTAGGITANGIARWDGSSWEAVDSADATAGYKGFSVISSQTMSVTALGEYDGMLVAAGCFHNVGGQLATHIARGVT